MRWRPHLTICHSFQSVGRLNCRVQERCPYKRPPRWSRDCEPVLGTNRRDRYAAHREKTRSLNAGGLFRPASEAKCKHAARVGGQWPWSWFCYLPHDDLGQAESFLTSFSSHYPERS